MLFVLIGDHLQRGWWWEGGGKGKKKIKRLLPRASLTSPQLGLSGAGLLALWQHMFGAKNTIHLHFFYMNFTKQKRSFVSNVSPKVSVAINHKWKFIGWWKAIILLAIFFSFFLLFFFFFFKVAASATRSRSLFDECAFKAVQFGSI